MPNQENAEFAGGETKVPFPKPERDIDLYRRAITTLQAALPLGWTLTSGKSRSLADAPERLLVGAPGGEVASFSVIPARGVLAGDAARFADSLSGSDRGFVCARYLSEPVRRQLDARGLSYADATGNTSLSADRPAIWVRDRGADADPWRGPGRPAAQLTGDPAARVVRALADHSGQLTVPELIRLAGASTGATYRVVETLEERELLERLPRGPITSVRWQQMLRAWSSDTSFKDCPTVGYFAPEGVQSFLAKLGKVSDHLYAVTGSVAAAAFAEYAPAHQIQIYADHGEALASALELRPVDQDANVLVATPRSAAVFERTLFRDNVRVVAPAQAFADLLAGTGRHPQEAEHLLDWMTANVPEWRTALGAPTAT
ncbi:helix-turn-helix domain-containing protein [Rhodococcus jostii]|uniref:helix-turn-helix domain-containing protein n=1 Tax=Rhodococcus jostii TaxID=132919 RepID=UPI0009335C06|nr:helix-turn-helix domain-containing protein [Rhodococcus jostii]